PGARRGLSFAPAVAALPRALATRGAVRGRRLLRLAGLCSLAGRWAAGSTLGRLARLDHRRDRRGRRMHARRRRDDQVELPLLWAVLRAERKLRPRSVARVERVQLLHRIVDAITRLTERVGAHPALPACLALR